MPRNPDNVQSVPVIHEQAIDSHYHMHRTDM